MVQTGLEAALAAVGEDGDKIAAEAAELVRHLVDFPEEVHTLIVHRGGVEVRGGAVELGDLLDRVVVVRLGVAKRFVVLIDRVFRDAAAALRRLGIVLLFSAAAGEQADQQAECKDDAQCSFHVLRAPFHFDPAVFCAKRTGPPPCTSIVGAQTHNSNSEMACFQF